MLVKEGGMYDIGSGEESRKTRWGVPFMYELKARFAVFCFFASSLFLYPLAFPTQPRTSFFGYCGSNQE